MEGSYEHPCPCSERVYWERAVIDDAFSARFFEQELGFDSWEVLSRHETDTELRRNVRGVAPIDDRVPKAFLRFLKRGLAFRELDVCDKRTRSAVATITSSSIGRRIAMSVRLRTRPTSDASCMVRFDVSIVASLSTALGGSSSYGIGGIVEHELLGHFLKGCETRGTFTQRFLEEQGLVGAT